MIRWFQRLLGDRPPESFAGSLDETEHLLASAQALDGVLVATSYGLWVPHGDAHRRIGWDHVSKATWAEDGLTIVEAEETARLGEAVLIRDCRPVRYRVDRRGKLPRIVRQRVDASIQSKYYKELPGGGAWFVQRKVPGRDGVVLQVRSDPGTDQQTVEDIAREAAEKMAEPEH